jgi:hypothetical protein
LSRASATISAGGRWSKTDQTGAEGFMVDVIDRGDPQPRRALQFLGEVEVPLQVLGDL